MGPERKRRFFDALVAMGFKEIEVGFPAASQTDFDFIRSLIEENLIPDDVTIQVLTQAREELIRRTVRELRGRQARHRPSLQLDLDPAAPRRLRPRPAGITEIAVAGAAAASASSRTRSRADTEIIYQYSPESFTGTELDFAVEICEAVMDVWQPTPERRMILNLPATVEMATPNVYADQIEWFCRNIRDRDAIILSSIRTTIAAPASPPPSWP